MGGDRALVRAALAGQPAAAETLIHRIADRVRAICRVIGRDEAEARESFSVILAGLQANGFARLRPYEGRGRLDTFVALVSRELLAERLLQVFHSDARRGWTAFERLFEVEFRRLILRRLPGPGYEEARRDAYQEICLALIEDDYRRIKAYGGTGSFAGFILRMADRLAIDHVRCIASRRRLPAAIERLAPLDRELFKLMHWRRLPAVPHPLLSALRGRFDPMPDLAAIESALARIRASLPDGPERSRGQRRETVTRSSIPGELLDDVVGEGGSSPEEILIDLQDQRELIRALEVLRQAAKHLPAADRLYLSIALGGEQAPPAREIARLMQRPVEEIYKLKQRVLRRLGEAIAEDAAVKSWRASL